MRSFLCLVMVLLLVAAVGCVSKEVKEKTHQQRVAVETYIEKFMDKEQTSQEQDQKVVRECYKTLLILDWGLNNDKDAKKRLDALKEGKEKTSDEEESG